jgi:RNA polymerase primary sigma factor
MDQTPTDSRALYGRAIDRHPVLGRAGEQALALQIEKRSHALWALLLARPTAAFAARLLRERLPQARSGITAEELHAIDLDHVVADELVAQIVAAARDPDHAPEALRAMVQRKRFARHAEAVASAARAVADARGRFVQANLGLVFLVAHRYHSSALSLADFAQEGMFGLIKAVDRFDHRRGLRFSTYAIWWIRHAIGRALADKDRAVRIPVHVQDARQRLRVLERRLRAELGREPSHEELAEAADVPLDKIEWYRQLTGNADISLDERVDDGDGRSRADTFVDPTDEPTDPAEALDRETLADEMRRHLEALAPIEREILQRRFGLDGLDDEATLREIASDHGLSRERIRQIEAVALRKLRKRLAGFDGEPSAHAA